MAETPHRKWRKSSYSDVEGNCVELARAPRGVAVRDSKAPDGPVAALSAPAFADLIASIKAGQRDL
ncbi:DUF397 domain-containing protein [Spirillospora sp. CA-128828]|uniref:DUF397 domain-containing protein n=1 Tax=Spirillospora sp. CA-128828 TaxID=3240033 RepID=UPI003D93EF6B